MRLTIACFYFFSVLLFIIGECSESCSWENCNKWSDDPNVINVHIICHSHSDLGWLKTVDQYYYGSNNLITTAAVQYIINTVMDELKKDTSRRFSWAETGFLWRWYRDHGDHKKHELARLIQRGQIEIIGGGWVQNDEATSHYIDIIDQMTFGLRKLNRTFGRCAVPQVAWQIDTFGHSREMANLFAMMDFKSLFFARVHYLEKNKRLENKTLDFIWNGSKDLKTNIFTGLFFQDSYGPPPGFCFDALCKDDPVMDNDEFDEYNLKKKIESLSQFIMKEASYRQTNHIMLLMGSDFTYSNANMWFSNLDKLIYYINEKLHSNLGNIKLFYSTPSCYTNAVRDASPKLHQKTDDFFPYASSNHSLWTGFYSSRPTLKRSIRENSALLQMVKQISALGNLTGSDSVELNILAEAVALAQHHDAITGTSREEVVQDYKRRLKRGQDKAKEVINNVMSKLAQLRDDVPLPEQKLCVRINESVCDVTRNSSQFTFTLFNTNSHPVDEVIKIPLYETNVIVQDHKGNEIDFQVNHVKPGKKLSNEDKASYEMYVGAILPPLSFTTFFVTKNKSLRKQSRYSEQRKRNMKKKFPDNKYGNPREQLKMKNDIMEVNFDANGYLSSVKLASGQEVKLRQEFLLYYGMGYSNSTEQSSGAYVFRPNGTAFTFGSKIELKITEGNIICEAYQKINDWISQIIRIYKNKTFIEFEWMIGPIPMENKFPETKEIITRYKSDIKSNGVFFTDANGRQMMERVRNHSPSFDYVNTEPIAANYYPSTTTMFIRDPNLQMTVLIDRSEGGSSINDGEIELMLHRRSFYDDHWGMEEALNETETDGLGITAKGRHWLFIDKPESSSSMYRPLASQLYRTPTILFSPLHTTYKQYKDLYRTQYIGIKKDLPSNVNIISFEALDRNSILIRLEHIYQQEEDTVLSQPATVDLNGMFDGFEIISVEELTLAANKLMKNSSQKSKKWNKTDRFLKTKEISPIVINPMEIITLKLNIRKKL